MKHYLFFVQQSTTTQKLGIGRGKLPLPSNSNSGKYLLKYCSKIMSGKYLEPAAGSKWNGGGGGGGASTSGSFNSFRGNSNNDENSNPNSSGSFASRGGGSCKEFESTIAEEKNCF